MDDEILLLGVRYPLVLGKFGSVRFRAYLPEP